MSRIRIQMVKHLAGFLPRHDSIICDFIADVLLARRAEDVLEHMRRSTLLMTVVWKEDS
jgi:hypothetical protein